MYFKHLEPHSCLLQVYQGILFLLLYRRLLRNVDGIYCNFSANKLPLTESMSLKVPVLQSVETLVAPCVSWTSINKQRLFIVMYELTFFMRWPFKWTIERKYCGIGIVIYFFWVVTLHFKDSNCLLIWGSIFSDKLRRYKAVLLESIYL